MPGNVVGPQIEPVLVPFPAAQISDEASIRGDLWRAQARSGEVRSRENSAQRQLLSVCRAGERRQQEGQGDGSQPYGSHGSLLEFPFFEGGHEFKDEKSEALWCAAGGYGLLAGGLQSRQIRGGRSDAWQRTAWDAIAQRQ